MAMLVLRIYGIVQGVGFRPFVWRIAHRTGVKGSVKNKGGYVEVVLQGKDGEIARFKELLRLELPPNAFIDYVEEEEAPNATYDDFSIVPSEETGSRLPSGIPPDIATCKNCIRELYDPRDRRFCYPFINCTDCGPRFTIVRSVPYDREKTSMSAFEMCGECRREYNDPLDRRYHAEPIACPANGPRYWLSTPDGDICEDAIGMAAELIDKGRPLAIKGMGGFHLACDATNDDAIVALREKLGRPYQPFAIMARDIGSVSGDMLTDEDTSALMASPSSPIVVLRRRSYDHLSPRIAPGLETVGVMLPYTPLHHLLFSELRTDAIVMTSANLPGNPMIKELDDARRRLPFMEGFLTHDLDIVNRCDDSVIRDGKFIRRSRGYVPLPIRIPNTDTTIAFGAEMNNVVAVSKAGRCILSQHIGNTSNWDVIDYALDSAGFLMQTSNIGLSDLDYLLCDKHPQYNTAIVAEQWSREMGLDLIRVQHHMAHSYALSAEHGVEEILCVASDGTGYGDDGNNWGGELLYTNRDPADNIRLGHLEYLRMPGGDLSAKYPLRMLLTILDERELERYAKYFEGGLEEALAIRKYSMRNAPLTSSTGRVLDAVCAMLELATVRTYDGECPMRLESLAFKGRDLKVDIGIDGGTIRTGEFLTALFGMMDQNSKEDIAMTAHMSLARAFIELVGEHRDLHLPVGFSGGVAYNAILSRALRKGVEAMDMKFLEHRLVPPGDGGISFGQSCIRR